MFTIEHSLLRVLLSFLLDEMASPDVMVNGRRCCTGSNFTGWHQDRVAPLSTSQLQ